MYRPTQYKYAIINLIRRKSNIKEENEFPRIKDVTSVPIETAGTCEWHIFY